MVHKKYRDFFIYTLRANANDFDNKYKRVIEEYGQSNETKLEFYKATFKSVINHLKNEIPVDSYRIQNSYKEFIHALRQDDNEVTDLVIEKSKFSISDLKVSMPIKQTPTYTPTYKAYNPNTKYGRKKAREQAQRNYENGSDEYRNDIDNIKIVVWSIIIVIAIFFFIIKAKLS
nr:hypothetical protein [uncultured Flavobacterium sp.]